MLNHCNIRPVKVHYYKRNIGDYAKKAGRLSILQHGIYNLLIDACYDREQFPTRDEAIDWIWASTKDELEALDFVLGKFFQMDDKGRYVQKRIKEALEDYHGFCKKQALNGGKGGRPPKDKKKTQSKPSGKKKKPSGLSEKPGGNPDERQKKPKPRTKNQGTKEPLTKEKKAQAKLAAELGVDVVLIERIVRHRRDIKKPADTDKKIKLVVNNFRQCVEQGYYRTLDEVMDKLDQEPWQTVKPEYLSGNGPGADRGPSRQRMIEEFASGGRVVSEQ